MGKRKNTRRDSEAALDIDPHFTPAHRNLESLSAGRAALGSRWKRTVLHGRVFM